MKRHGVFLRILLIVGVAEFLVMFFLWWLRIPEGIGKYLLDAGLLMTLTAPFLYLWVVQVMAQRLSERNFRDLIEGLDAIVWEADPATLALTFVNRRAEEILGYPAQQWLTEPDFWADHIHPADREQTLALLHRTALEGGDGEWEYRFLAADGHAVWFRDKVRLRREPGKETARLRGIMVDITKRKQAEEALQRSEEKLRDFLDNASDLIQSVTPEGRFTYVNRTWRERLGYREEEVPGLRVFDIIHPDHREHCVAEFQRVLQGEALNNIETVFLTKDGRSVHLSGNVNCRFQDGKPVASRGIFRDTTEARQAEKALEEANQKLTRWVSELERRNREAHLLNEMGDFLLTSLSMEEACTMITQFVQRLFPTDSGALYVTAASRNFVKVVAIWGESFAGEHAFAPGDCRALRRGKMHVVEEPGSGLVCAHLGQSPPSAYLCVPMMAQGEALGVLHLQISPSSLDQSEGNGEGRMESKQRLAVAVAEHIALTLANLTLRESLRTQSIRDPLTGLFNRRYMEESLERELHRASRKQRPLGAIMMDLDYFKRFNDTLGHEAGDTLLSAVGHFLQKHSREEDIACRYGGEEFILILPDTSLEILQRRAEQLREGTKSLNVSFRGQPLGTVTLSLGAACFPEHCLTREGLLRAADAALYRAKQQGRDQVVIAEPVLE